jgi:drug/metabolite transporter (DMT)-like permease
MMPDHSRGVWLMLIGVLIVPWLDGFAKLLGQTLPFLEVAWARFSVQLIVILPLAWFRLGRNMLSLGQWRLQVLRGALLVLASTLFFASLRTMEIADAIAVFFIHPLLTVVIAPILLREKVGLRRWLAALIGFSGALLVIRPGLEHFDWNSLYALATGFCFSGYVLLGRRLAGEGSPLQALVMTGLVGTLMMSFFQPAVWIKPQGIEWVWMGAMGSIGLIGHYFIIKALEHAPASRLAPLGYFEIIGSVLVGLIAFGDLPDAWTWSGIAIIVCSGLYVMHQSRLKQES